MHEFAFDHLVIELLNVAPFQFFDIAVAQSGIDLIFDGPAIPLISIELDARFAVGEKHPRQIGYGDFFALFDFVGSGIFALHDQSQNPFGFLAGLGGSDLRRLGDRQLLLLAVSIAVHDDVAGGSFADAHAEAFERIVEISRFSAVESQRAER